MICLVTRRINTQNSTAKLWLEKRCLINEPSAKVVKTITKFLPQTSSAVRNDAMRAVKENQRQHSDELTL